MKKILLILSSAMLMIFSLAACTSTELAGYEGSTTQLSVKGLGVSEEMEEAIIKLRAVAKAELVFSEEPYYDLIGAQEAVQFSIGTSTVKLYGYESEAAYETAFAKYPILSEFPKSGLIIIESANATVVSAFVGEESSSSIDENEESSAA